MITEIALHPKSQQWLVRVDGIKTEKQARYINNLILDSESQCSTIISKLERKVELLESQNKRLSSKLITQQEDTQGQAQFLDALENLLLDHGFKVVSIHE